jgi:predicted NAD/FAD-dependent oxidoreductase
VETVTVKDSCEKARGTASRMETRRSNGSSFEEDDSEFTRFLEAFRKCGLKI